MDPDSCRLCLYALDSESTSIILYISIILLLIILSAFLAASETAFSCCNKNRIKSRAEDGDKSAKRVLKILNNIDKGIVAVLIAINIAHVLMSTIATILFVKLLGPNGTIVSTVVITILVFIFSETLPKNIAKIKADKLVDKYSGFIITLIYILYPLVLIFSWPYKFINKNNEDNEYDENDLQTMVETIEEEGVLDEEESSLIQNAIEFDSTRASDVYTPLDKVTALDINLPKKTIIEELSKDKQYSRIPMFDKTKTKIKGALPTRIVLKEYLANPKINLIDYLIKPFYVSKTARLDDILDGFNKNKTHIGYVVDKGVVIGLITMDDVLDELVEDIVEGGDNNG